MKAKNIPLWIIILILIVMVMSVLIIYIERYTLPTPQVADGLTAIISAFVGILITIAVTAMLLEKQSRMDSDKEKNIIQFKQKQDTYVSFLKKFESMMVSLTERNIKGNDCMAYENITKLENLLFEFSYLRMHMSQERFGLIMNHVSQIFENYNEIKLRDLYQAEIVEAKKRKSPKVNTSLYNLMMGISEHLFVISELLNQDLYGYEKKLDTSDISQLQAKTSTLLYKCGLRQHESEVLPVIDLEKKQDTVNKDIEEQL